MSLLPINKPGPIEQHVINSASLSCPLVNRLIVIIYNEPVNINIINRVMFIVR